MFKTKLFGLDVEVTGTFYKGNSTLDDEFDIERITHFGKRMDIEALPEDEFVRIHLEAFESNKNQPR